ncbi:odorant receptor 131-2-like [Engystomops pustulosus]|uniref:odorant receptor 131-2-like n=1 Tax=Engystomops pustulosus TaxID=76066 RepID=UPI003AFA7407
MGSCWTEPVMEDLMKTKAKSEGPCGCQTRQEQRSMCQREDRTLLDFSTMMVNSTLLYNNVTQVSIFTSKTNEILRLVFFLFIFLFLCIFMYFMTVLLIVYFTTPHVRDNSRYILFVHMLINDTLYLILTVFLSLAFQFNLYIQVPVCYFLLTLATSSFKVIPYNLAAMALERYIAICFPLQHAIFCTAQRTYATIMIMWLIGLIPGVADFAVFSHFVQTDFFSRKLICKQEGLLIQPVQNTLRSSTYISTIFLVAFIILFTYIKVMLVARKSGSGKSSASRAGRTLILHSFQLILCMMSLTSSFTESYRGDYVMIVTMVNFLLFMCFPRLLSPLIYGIRDEVFNKCIKKMYSKNL